LLDGELATYDDFLARDWLESALPARMPRLADYLSLEAVEKLFAERGLSLKQRQFDEKFHTLQAPTLLTADIAYYREVSAARGNNLAVAYIDIDDFKNLNTKYGHPRVDTSVLPVFMRALESFTFARGYAYRYGGDEYALLLANGQGAGRALEHLQKQIYELRYPDIEERLCISVGFCEVSAELFLSDEAIIERANLAMRHAKAKGKNRIATFKQGSLYRESDLIILPLRQG
jgi:diguanylate cyclase (GGDEF)-like protein